MEKGPLDKQTEELLTAYFRENWKAWSYKG